MKGDFSWAWGVLSVFLFGMVMGAAMCHEPSREELPEPLAPVCVSPDEVMRVNRRVDRLEHRLDGVILHDALYGVDPE